MTIRMNREYARNGVGLLRGFLLDSWPTAPAKPIAKKVLRPGGVLLFLLEEAPDDKVDNLSTLISFKSLASNGKADILPRTVSRRPLRRHQTG